MRHAAIRLQAEAAVEESLISAEPDTSRIRLDHLEPVLANRDNSACSQIERKLGTLGWQRPSIGYWGDVS